MNNVHINMNEFTNASRVLKQVESLVKYDVFENVIIIALGSTSLPQLEQVSDKISLHRISLLTRSLPKNLLFQPLKYLEFSLKSLLLMYKVKPHTVNAHTLGVLPIALVSKILFKSKLVYDAHELETETNGLKGLRKFISKSLEKILIKYTDIVFVVSESIADWYVNEYKIYRPTVILNVPNKRILKNNNHFREQLGIREDQVIFLYQGGLIEGRGINFVLDTFKTRKEDSMVVVFMGYGELDVTIKAAAKEFNNIYFFPAVPPQVVLEYTASADIGISLIENTCLSYYYCMPNKLFEYAMAGLPILVSNMKDMSELVTENNMGTVITSISTKNINNVLDSFLQYNLKEMKKNAYRVAIENAWEIQERKMITAYKDMFEEDKSDSAYY